MNLTQAKAAMARLVGKRATWRYDDKAPGAEEREGLWAKSQALADVTAQAKAALDARRAELLRDPDYLRLKAAWVAAHKEHSEAFSRARRHRVCIGRSNGIFNVVLAEGDNWQDAIDKLESKTTK
jgi:hypothetical protein